MEIDQVEFLYEHDEWKVTEARIIRFRRDNQSDPMSRVSPQYCLKRND